MNEGHQQEGGRNGEQKGREGRSEGGRGWAGGHVENTKNTKSIP